MPKTVFAGDGYRPKNVKMMPLAAHFAASVRIALGVRCLRMHTIFALIAASRRNFYADALLDVNASCRVKAVGGFRFAKCKMGIGLYRDGKM